MCVRVVEGKRRDEKRREPSFVSMKSDQSMTKLIKFSDEDCSADHRSVYCSVLLRNNSTQTHTVIHCIHCISINICVFILFTLTLVVKFHTFYLNYLYIFLVNFLQNSVSNMNILYIMNILLTDIKYCNSMQQIFSLPHR